MSSKQSRPKSTASSQKPKIVQDKPSSQPVPNTAPANASTLARLVSHARQMFAEQPAFKEYTGKSGDIVPRQQSLKSESREKQEGSGPSKMILNGACKKGSEKREVMDDEERDAEEVNSQRRTPSSKTGGSRKNSLNGHSQRGQESNTAQKKSNRSTSKDHRKGKKDRQSDSDWEEENLDTPCFPMNEVIKKKRYTFNPITNRREEFKPQGKEVVFPEMEIMLCQIVKGFNAKGYHATQSDLSQLALRMLEFMNQRGFYSEHEPDLSEFARPEKKEEKGKEEQEIAVSSDEEMEDDSTHKKRKSNKIVFRASKGWVEKFLLRNKKIAQIYSNIRNKEYRRGYRKIDKDRLQWLIHNSTWDALLQKNIDNDWEKDNGIAYVPPFVAESPRKIIKKFFKRPEKVPRPRRKREPKKNVKEVVVNPKEEEERLKRKYALSQESISFKGCQAHRRIKLPSGKKVIVHYDRDATIKQPSIAGSEKKSNRSNEEKEESCKIERSRKKTIEVHSKKIKKGKKVGRRHQEEKEYACEKMIDEDAGEEYDSDKENEKAVRTKALKAKGKGKVSGKVGGKAKAGESHSKGSSCSRSKNLKKKR